MGNFPQYKEKLYTCYMLKHIKTGKVYIGISSSFGTRISNHLLDLYGNRHSNYLLQKDMAKALNITQQDFSARLNPKTYRDNRKSDPFKYGELLILFKVLDATAEEIGRLMTL